MGRIKANGGIRAKVARGRRHRRNVEQYPYRCAGCSYRTDNIIRAVAHVERSTDYCFQTPHSVVMAQ